MQQYSFSWIMKLFLYVFCIFRSVKIFSVCPAILMEPVISKRFLHWFAVRTVRHAKLLFQLPNWEVKSSLVKETEQSKYFLHCAFPFTKRGKTVILVL